MGVGNFNPQTRTIQNTNDTTRKWPIEDMGAKIMSTDLGMTKDKVTGPTGSAGLTPKVKLTHPVATIRAVKSYVTATGAFSAKPNLIQGVDFSVNPADPSNNGNGTLTNLTVTDYSAATWEVDYSPLEPDGTIGGQSLVGN
jgi:hypothetical protein